MELDKNFQPNQIEQHWYKKWEESGHFLPNMNEKAPSFCIHLPPPNITGTLHMGHAFGQTIMDSLTRFHRMKGYNTLWLPGTDHAGIATQIVVEKQLSSQGIAKSTLSREKFIKKLWEWKNISGNTINQQMRRVGCSVDWSKAYFTMDDTYAGCVIEIFVRLYQEGLIYRGKRLVNWDPVLCTAISDIEVENVEEEGQIWYIRYPSLDSKDQDVIVATTRPETMLGDVAVAVNPKDPRYQSLIGKILTVPLTNRQIPVIADQYVDSAFGTGCLKITPAHDFNDYEIGKRHQTELINILTLDGKIRSETEVIDFDNRIKPTYFLPAAYVGLDCQTAREKIVVDLKSAGYLVDAKPHQLKVPRGDRTGVVIEPMLTNQWFVAMNKISQQDPTQLTLAQKAIQAVENGKVHFLPENWIKTYNQWMHNIQDWCISRQLWWGHRIPAWYDPDGNIYVAHHEEEAYQQYLTKLNHAGKNLGTDLSITALQKKGFILKQDEDVLDTWFSSAIVPFSTLGWPNSTPEIKTFLPSSVLVTGYEILFFWVARMIMITMHFTGKVPFNTVYIHGMVRDHDGKKMSKSEGNVIDPVDLLDGIDLQVLLNKRTTGLRRPETAPKIIQVTKKLFPEGIPDYGADALRFTMASYANLGRNINFDFNRCKGYRNFCNKLWHATRFVLIHTENNDCKQPIPSNIKMNWIDEWIISRLQTTIAEVTDAFENYRLDWVAQILYEFTWNEYCSWYLELAKIQLMQNKEVYTSTHRTLLTTLETLFRLIHPIMPFITEELWQSVASRISVDKAPFIMLAPWPISQPSLIKDKALAKVATLKEMVEAVRHLRSEMHLDPTIKIPLIIEDKESFTEFFPYLQSLARLSTITSTEKIANSQAPYVLVNQVRFMLEVDIDNEAEKIRLTKEISKLDKEFAILSMKLEKLNQSKAAPIDLVKQIKEKQILCQTKKTALQVQLDNLSQTTN
jgi:valyl-tRNA synthetase